METYFVTLHTNSSSDLIMETNELCEAEYKFRTFSDIPNSWKNKTDMNLVLEKHISDNEDLEVIDSRQILPVNGSSDSILNEVDSYFQKKYGKYKYNNIKYNDESDEYFKLRISDHSGNPANNRGVRTLSIVICNDNDTEGLFRQNDIQMYFNEDFTAEEIITEVESQIQELIENF